MRCEKCDCEINDEVGCSNPRCFHIWCEEVQARVSLSGFDDVTDSEVHNVIFGLRKDNAALKAEVKRLKAMLDKAVEECGHSRNCNAIKGPNGENWIVESDCCCWMKEVKPLAQGGVEMREQKYGETSCCGAPLTNPIRHRVGCKHYNPSSYAEYLDLPSKEKLRLVRAAKHKEE